MCTRIYMYIYIYIYTYMQWSCYWLIWINLCKVSGDTLHKQSLAGFQSQYLH